MNQLLEKFFKTEIEQAKHELRLNSIKITSMADTQRGLKKRIKYLNMARKEAEKDATINELVKRKPKSTK